MINNILIIIFNCISVFAADEATEEIEDLKEKAQDALEAAGINKIIEDNKLYELNTEAFTLATNTPRRFTFNPVDVASRRSNYIILKARNLTPGKSFPMIVSFGSDSGKNGGFVLAISENEEEKTYIFRIGSQYKWFSEDNTWIEIISENNEVEIGKLEVSRSN